jgi:hypothetical protein
MLGGLALRFITSKIADLYLPIASLGRVFIGFTKKRRGLLPPFFTGHSRSITLLHTALHPIQHHAVLPDLPALTMIG